MNFLSISPCIFLPVPIFKFFPVFPVSCCFLVSFSVSPYPSPCLYFLMFSYLSCTPSLFKFYFCVSLYPAHCPYFLIPPFSCERVCPGTPAWGNWGRGTVWGGNPRGSRRQVPPARNAQSLWQGRISLSRPRQSRPPAHGAGKQSTALSVPRDCQVRHFNCRNP